MAYKLIPLAINLLKISFESCSINSQKSENSPIICLRVYSSLSSDRNISLKINLMLKSFLTSIR